MQSKSFIQTAIEENVTNTAVPVVLAEWNMMRYTTVKDGWPLTNETAAQKAIPTEYGYPNLFPINSITKPFRDPGIVYSYLYNSYSASYSGTNEANKVRTIKPLSWNRSEANRTDNRLYPRCYYAGRTNQFKYWISSAATLAKTDANGRTAGQFSCTLQNSSRALQLDIEFDTTVTTNKITSKFNTHIGNPQSVSFYVKQSGVWNLVASGLNVPNSGILEVWRPVGGGTWTTTPVYYTEAAPNNTDIDGVRILVDSMQRTTPVSSTVESAVNARLELIELTPRLVVDLSARTTGYDVSNELGSNSYGEAFPGNITTNTGSISFINDDGFFDTSTTSTIINNKLDENVEFTVDLVYNASIGGTTAQRTVRQLTMISDGWSGTDESETTVNLSDYSKILQEAKPQETLVKNIPAYAAIWLLLDGIGMNRVSVKRSAATEDDLVMEWFWVTDQQNVWDVIREIAESYQLAVFFDEFGTLKVMTRKYLWDRDSATTTAVSADSTLWAVNNGVKLSNIFSISRNELHNINKAIVRYQAVNKYGSAGRKNKKRSMNSILWRAPDTLVVGAAEIVSSFAQGATQIKIDPRYEDALFKYAGKFVIEDTGRVFEYTAKKFQYTDGTSNTVWISNENDMQAAIEANNGIRPVFTGWLRLANPTGKALDSVVYDFRQNWQSMKYVEGSTSGTNTFTPLKFVKLGGDKSVGGALSVTTAFTGGARYKIWKKNETYDKYDRVGIKFKMVTSGSQAGVVIFPQGTNMAGGYHVSVTTDDAVGLAGVTVARVNTQGVGVQLQVDPAKDYEGPDIKKGRWYYLEAVVWGTTNAWNFNVYINGNFIGTWSDNSQAALPRTQKAQFFVRGDSRVLFDKFYVVNTRGKKGDRKGDESRPSRKDLLYNRKLCPGDKKFNQYLSDYLRRKFDARLWVYNFNSAGWATAREIAHFNVDFEMPAIRQWIYVANKSVHPSRYKRRAMGASFTLTNTSESNQLVNGTRETRVSGSNHDEATYIYGQVFRLQDEQKIQFSDDDSIHRIGENAFDITAKWIQTRSAANDLATFVRGRFNVQARSYDLEIYGNPLIQIGDVVSVYWPGKKIAASNYLVTKVSHSFDQGLVTNVQLLSRADIAATDQTVFDESVDQDANLPARAVRVPASTYSSS